jgi:2-C-methyl-D-erythritol 4-phosphate cytidylyltransferase/2-C-methyl-D-erythritol 2,4-cyclodiphosphate synthase
MTARIRIGQGFDVHRFRAGRPLRLCGHTVEGEVGLEGHSDADVALHAVTDALLGAIARGDIGEIFPPSDPKWRDADSRIFLAGALEMVGIGQGNHHRGAGVGWAGRRACGPRGCASQ